MVLDENNITHLSKSFFSDEDIHTLESGKSVLRVEPCSRGGKCYLISKGGYHYAKMQEIISWAIQ